MCGISGVISREIISTEIIQSITHTLAHRGPDYQNTYLSPDQKVALGHTRLSIIDLSERANQPMHSVDGRYVVVFNGEIYNFKKLRSELEANDPRIRMTSNSDTEIILHAFNKFGIDMVKRLEGMFAIAIYDTLLSKIFLFRDRIGKKPIFYFCNHSDFIFTSEIKALLNHPSVKNFREIDKQAVHEFLHLGYIPEPKTIYRSIKKFPAGHVGEVYGNLSFKIYPYWQVDDQISRTQHSSLKSDNEYKEVLKGKLHDAVENRLISDVPLGAFLSGGTDSSLISAIASEHMKGSLKTFAIGFKESKFDEHHYAAKVASYLKTDHREYILSESEAAEILETYLDHLDEPFADTSAIPTMLVSKMARKEVKVTLTGDGGDELFLGYGTYTWANRLSNPLLQPFQFPLAKLFEKFGDNKYKRIVNLLHRVDRDKLRSHIFSQEQYFFSDAEIRNELLKHPINYEPFRYNDTSRFEPFLSEAEKQAIFDLKYYLKDDLLVKVDRSSMFRGLECRCPLLDTRIIEFALNAPLHIKRRKGVNKWILKEILSEYLPTDLVHRPKWGFGIPLAQWLKNEFNYLMKYLNEEELSRTGLFNHVFVNNLVSRFMRGENYLYNRLWALIIVQRFLLKNDHC
jgi:asparagine synthase (glutamine-hydrolysing)